MTRDDFNKIVEARFEKIRTTLMMKGKEYSTNKDVFHNFKESSKLANEANCGVLIETPESELCGFLRKHLISIFDCVGWAIEDPKKVRNTIDEKIGDAINYLILLEGLFEERLNANKVN